MLVSSAHQQIAGEVRLVQALLDDDLMPLRRIIEARAHGAVPPFHRRRSLRIRRRLVDAVGVIDDDVVAAFSRSRRHRHYDPVAGPVIFEPLLLVLIVSELEPAAPALLVPVRLNQTPAFQAIADRQWLAVAAEQPSGFGVLDPRPRGPKHTRQERFGMTWRNVDDEMRDPPFRYRLQMETDRVDVDAFHELSARFQNRPSLHHECLQAAPCPLHFHWLQLESWPVQGASRGDRVLHR